MNTKTFCGFSGNPAEYLYLDGGVGDKRMIERHCSCLEGSSINVSQALKTFGFRGEVMAAILVGGSVHDDMGRLLFERMANNLEGICLERVEVLSSTNRAWVDVSLEGKSDHRIRGWKGKILSELVEVASMQIEKAASGSTLAILTSQRPSEIPFAEAVFKAVGHGKIVMSLHGETLRNGSKEDLDVLLGMSRFIFMNRAEQEVLSQRGIDLSDMHSMGPELVVITDGDRDGEYSLRGRLGAFKVQPLPGVCTDGAGDKLMAAFAVRLLSGMEIKSSSQCEKILTESSFAVRATLV